MGFLIHLRFRDYVHPMLQFRTFCFVALEERESKTFLKARNSNPETPEVEKDGIESNQIAIINNRIYW